MPEPGSATCQPWELKMASNFLRLSSPRLYNGQNHLESFRLIRLLWGLREIINANVLGMVKGASDGMHVLWW